MPRSSPWFHSVLVALSLAGCSPTGVAVPRVLAPPEVSFSSVPVDTSVTRDVLLDNPGAAAASVQLTVEPPFAVAATQETIPATGSLAVPISVRAPDYAAFTGSLTVTWDGGTHDVSLLASVNDDLDADGHIAVGAGGTDCDDGDDGVHPGVAETCDGRDEDCDAAIDEDATDRFEVWPDADGDDYGTGTSTLVCSTGPDQAPADGDCDDTDASVYPGAAETFYDGVDSDCLGDSDYDADGDGQDSEDYGGLDCDDTEESTYDGALDPPYDGVDSDCGGGSDFDDDGDGLDSADYGGTDCDDGDAGRYPGNPETADGVDQDCDVLVDEDFVARGDWSLSELHLSPTATDGAFVELHNTSGESRDLAGLRFASGTDDALLPPMAVPADGRAVLCTSLDTSVNGGIDSCAAAVPIALDASLWLKSTALDEVDASSWSLPNAASLETTEGPDTNDDESAWCTATASYGDGDLGTPGDVASCP